MKATPIKDDMSRPSGYRLLNITRLAARLRVQEDGTQVLEIPVYPWPESARQAFDHTCLALELTQVQKIDASEYLAKLRLTAMLADCIE